MEMVYRGYPPQRWFEGWADQNRIQTEYEYIRGLYPWNVRKWQRLVEEEFDRTDGPGSFIYDEWPDREPLYWMRRQIMGNAGEQGDITGEDLVMVLILHEMLRRREQNNMPFYGNDR